MTRWARPLLAILLGSLASCAAVVNVADYSVSRSQMQGATGASDADLADLGAGRITLVRQRYESRPPDSLSPAQLGLLCDIEVKFGAYGAASACLDRAESRTGPTPALAGKRALIALALGDPRRAADLTTGSDSAGALYVHALARARLGDTASARFAAARFGLKFDNQSVFFAATLYSAAGDDAAALRLVEDPERRLLRDYGIGSPTATAAPFHLDVFDEFGFGALTHYSYAPAANPYVEYLAAHSMLRTGRVADATAHFDALLAYPNLDAYRDVAWLALLERGQIALRAGHAEEGQMLVGRSIAVIEGSRRSVSTDEGRVGFAADKQGAYTLMVDALIASGKSTAALEYAERSRNRVMVDLLANQDDLVPREMASSEARGLLGDLRTAEGGAHLAEASPAGGEAIRQRIAGRAPALGALIGTMPVSLTALRETLAPDETAVAYYESLSGWVAFVLTRLELTTVALPSPSLPTLIVAYNRALVTGGGNAPSAGFMRDSRALYDALLGPVMAKVHTPRLLIVPDGVLHYVAFAALHDGDKYLAERAVLRIVPSLSALTFATRAAHGEGSLIMGNPDRPDAPPLPGAEIEADRVKEVLPSPAVYVRSAASLDQFLRGAPGKAFIHIASHGQFQPADPLQSRVLLTADSGNTGDLTVSRVYTMRLDAKLVTLSACDTGQGGLKGSEIIGLVRGFSFAGAQNVVATLWQVNDEATAELMSAFYRAVQTTKSVPDALHAAQMATMQKYPNPYFWAGFVPVSFEPRI